MDIPDIKQKKRVLCVVCGKGFNNYFDDELKVYPHYYPSKVPFEESTCAIIFYDTLISIYNLLHEHGTSLPLSVVLQRTNWSSVHLPKELLSWCLWQGYLNIDNLKRLIVPPAIHDITKELFTIVSLSNPDALQKARDYLKTAFQVKRSQLKPSKIQEEEPPEMQGIQNEDIHHFSRMFTADITGVDANTEPRKRIRGMHTR